VNNCLNKKCKEEKKDEKNDSYGKIPWRTGKKIFRPDGNHHENSAKSADEQIYNSGDKVIAFFVIQKNTPFILL
jgi:hypothetical protein